MKSLHLARARARELRASIGNHHESLLDRLVEALLDDHRIEVVGVPAIAIHGSRAELHPADGCIWYDRELDEAPPEKLLILAHELGHVVLHPRLYRTDTQLNFLVASAYLDVGSGGLTRYSRKGREEAEANAFALEFVCPADVLFSEWRAGATAAVLASRLELPLNLIRMQLAEALAERDTAEDAERGAEPTLDKRQVLAAETVGIPTLIDAGPGTGKTATLVRRIQFLVRELAAPPESLLVLTFSNEAAEEIRERVLRALGDDAAARLHVQTFHGFGVEILRNHGHLVGIPADAPIIDEIRQRELISTAVGALRRASILDLTNLDHTVDRALRHIGYLKDRNVSVESLRAACKSDEGPAAGGQGRRAIEEFLELYHRYEEAKAAAGVLDFGDLIMGPIRVVEESPDLMAALREQYPWILVDEYQDVGRSVAQLLKLLAGPENPPWAVGDARQAIYRFRGAAPENVTRFGEDFPGSQIVKLESNYRSSPEIVNVANQLAEAIDSVRDGDEPSRWVARGTEHSLHNPIVVAEATSDASEHRGIVEAVREWLSSGVSPDEVAVLGRRNVDVRNVALALGAAGIPAVASAVVTAEGAAGDLAAVLTLADKALSSVPRVAFALGRNRVRQGMTNEAIKLARAGLEREEARAASLDGRGESIGLANEVLAVVRLAEEGLHSEDGFEAVCAFLFDRSEYLRRLLEVDATPEGRLALGEIRSCLAMAANYRFTHPRTPPRASRMAFAAHLRRAICGGTPAAIPPRAVPGAVRVLTCHAAKGLEFPCVLVMGQTVGPPDSLDWLPVGFRPDSSESVEQSNSLLFVGVTRAKRAVAISYSLSRSGGRASRKITPLLERWRHAVSPPSVQWDYGGAEPETIAMGAVWGGKALGMLPARHLTRDRCAIKSYLDLALDLFFPEAEARLYPFFIGRLRQAMRRLVSTMLENRDQLDGGVVTATVEEIWPEAWFAEHPYYQLYRPLLSEALHDFVRTLGPPSGATPLNAEVEWAQHGGPARLTLDMVAYYLRSDGHADGVVLHFSSLGDSLNKTGTAVLWGKLGDSQRVPLALLDLHHEGRFHPYVYSIADATSRPYLWHRAGKKPVGELAERAVEKARNLASGRFETVVDEYACDRCASRICCPFWMGLAS